MTARVLGEIGSQRVILQGGSVDERVPDGDRPQTTGQTVRHHALDALRVGMAEADGRYPDLPPDLRANVDRNVKRLEESSF